MLYWHILPTRGGVIQKVRKGTQPFEKEGWHDVSNTEHIDMLRSSPMQLRWDDHRKRLVTRHKVTLCKSTDFFPADGEAEGFFTVSGVPDSFERVRVILNSRIILLPRGEPLSVATTEPGLYQFGLIDAAMYATPDAITMSADPIEEEPTP